MFLLRLLTRITRAMPVVAVAFAAAAVPSLSQAAGIEGRITMVVGYPAGSITDLLARKAATYISSKLGQPVVVENRPGGGGIIAAEHVKKAPGDGHTLMVVPPSFVFSPVFRPQTEFNPINDFTPIAMLASTTMALYVNKNVPASNLREFINYSKTLSGGVSVGNTGNGSASHVAAELLRMQTGAKLTVIPYRGGAPAANDLLGGQLPSLFYDVGSMSEHVKSGAVKPIGTTGRHRSPIMPDVPTLAEQGAKDFDVDTWFALVGPAKMPTETVRTLNRLAVEAFQTSESAAWMKERGLVAASSSPEEVGAFFKSEVRKWTDFNKTAKIQME